MNLDCLFRTFNSYSFNFNGGLCNRHTGFCPCWTREASSFCDFWKIISSLHFTPFWLKQKFVFEMCLVRSTMTVFTWEQKCAILILISKCAISMIIRMTVFWTMCTQNYIAMRNLNCAIWMIKDHHLNCAFQITHRDVSLHTHDPKYCHSNDHSIAHFELKFNFWYQVCENRTVGREVTRRFVLARRHKICPKSAFCIGLCTKHMEITDFLKMH